MVKELLSHLQHLDAANEKTDGTDSYIFKPDRRAYLSGMPFMWSSFIDRAFIFRDAAQAAQTIAEFPGDLSGAEVRSQRTLAEVAAGAAVIASMKPDYLREWSTVPADADIIVCAWKDDSCKSFRIYQARTWEHFDPGTTAEFQIVARIWKDAHARRIAINPEIPPAWEWMRERLDGWMEAGKAWSDILACLGSTSHFVWSGPAMRKNRQAALAALLGRKVKAAEAGVNLLINTLFDKIGARGDCLATRCEELNTFLKIAAAVCRKQI